MFSLRPLRQETAVYSPADAPNRPDYGRQHHLAGHNPVKGIILKPRNDFVVLKRSGLANWEEYLCDGWDPGFTRRL